MRMPRGWETVLAMAASLAARAFMPANAYAGVTSELVTLLGIVMAAFIPTMLLAATTLRAGRFSTARVVALASALDRQIALFGGLFLYALLACLLTIAGKMVNWHLLTVEMWPVVPRHADFDAIFAVSITGLLTFLALRSLALIAGIRSLLRLSTTMAIDEAGEAEDRRTLAERAEIDRSAPPTQYRDPVPAGKIQRFE